MQTILLSTIWWTTRSCSPTHVELATTLLLLIKCSKKLASRALVTPPSTGSLTMSTPMRPRWLHLWQSQSALFGHTRARHTLPSVATSRQSSKNRSVSMVITHETNCLLTRRHRVTNTTSWPWVPPRQLRISQATMASSPRQTSMQLQLTSLVLSMHVKLSSSRTWLRTTPSRCLVMPATSLPTASMRKERSGPSASTRTENVSAE